MLITFANVRAKKPTCNRMSAIDFETKKNYFFCLDFNSH